MIANLASGQNGEISLRQLGALGDAAQRGAAANSAGVTKAGKLKPGDAAAQMLENQYINQYERALANPATDAAAAAAEFEEKVLQLRKTQFIAVLAVREVVGIDPYDLANQPEG